MDGLMSIDIWKGIDRDRIQARRTRLLTKVIEN